MVRGRGQVSLLGHSAISDTHTLPYFSPSPSSVESVCNDNPLDPRAKGQSTPSENVAQRSARPPSAQPSHSTAVTKEPKGKARASPLSPQKRQKPPRRFTPADIKLIFDAGQKIKCPWPECGQYVPIDQSLFSFHIIENEETHHLKKINYVRCPFGCTDIPYNVSRHILRDHYDRVIECPVDNCGMVIVGDTYHIIRHLSAAKHSDYEKPADGRPIELMVYAWPK